MAKTEKVIEYETLWRNKFLTVDAQSIGDMEKTLRGAADQLAAMARAGITLDPNGGTDDDYARLVTTDPKVATEFGLELVEIEADAL